MNSNFEGFEVRQGAVDGLFTALLKKRIPCFRPAIFAQKSNLDILALANTLSYVLLLIFRKLGLETLHHAVLKYVSLKLLSHRAELFGCFAFEFKIDVPLLKNVDLVANFARLLVKTLSQTRCFPLLIVKPLCKWNLPILGLCSVFLVRQSCDLHQLLQLFLTLIPQLYVVRIFTLLRI